MNFYRNMSYVINIHIHTLPSSHKPFLKSLNKQFCFLSAILNFYHHGRKATGTITLDGKQVLHQNHEWFLFLQL